jgi:transposase
MAVKLSHLPGVQVQDVAKALDIHPFTLSRWRKEYREGLIMDNGKPDIEIPAKVNELNRLRQLEKEHDLPPKDVPHLKLEFCHFLFLNSGMPLVLEDGNSMNCVA